MNRSHLVVWLTLAAGFGLALLLLPTLAGPANPILAAPRSEQSFDEWLAAPGFVSYVSQVTCTLAITTTDPLPGINDFSSAAVLANYDDLALVAGNRGAEVEAEEDYFRLANAIPGYTYEVQAVPNAIGNYNLGIVAYNASQTAVLTDANTLDGNDATVRLKADTNGPYFFKVYQISDFCEGGTYDLRAVVIPPTGTPTPTSTPGPGPTNTPIPPPTPIPGADRFEPNYSFEKAATLATDVEYKDLNFVPWGRGEVDNDYYKIWVKPDLLFTCETYDLGPGVDTNMIFYDSNRNVIAGNDDIELGEYRSRLSYSATYEGFLYVLVGHGGRLPLTDATQSSYSLRCTKSIPGMPTLTPLPKLLPTATPRPNATPTSPTSPLPTPTPSNDGELTVRLLTTPPAPSPEGTPSLQFVPVDLLIYYDGNNDRSPGAGEGVSNILILAYDTTTGEQVAEGFTDELGHLQFTAAAEGALRLSVPYLGVSQVVGREGASVYIRITPQQLPSAIP